jgi:hypothetical protein
MSLVHAVGVAGAKCAAKNCSSREPKVAELQTALSNWRELRLESTEAIMSLIPCGELRLMKADRRNFLSKAGAAGLYSPLFSLTLCGAESAARGGPAEVEARQAEILEILRQPVLKKRLSTSPVVIKSLELLRWENSHLCGVGSADGDEGISVAHTDMRRLYPIILHNPQPFFLVQDARELDLILDKVFIYGFNFRYNRISLGLRLFRCSANTTVQTWISTRRGWRLRRGGSDPVGKTAGGEQICLF